MEDTWDSEGAPMGYASREISKVHTSELNTCNYSRAPFNLLGNHTNCFFNRIMQENCLCMRPHH